MPKDVFWLTVGIFAFGLWAVYLGIMVRLGKWRSLLLYRGFPVLAPTGAFLIAIPMGLGIIAIGFMMVFPDNKDLIGIPMLVFSLSGVILSFWLPDWLLPDWFRWLIENYEHVLSEMFEEAWQMGLKEWEKETRTQAGLENWAKHVAEKRGLRSKKEMEMIRSLATRTYPHQDIDDPATLWKLHMDAYEKARSKEVGKKRSYGLLKGLVSIATFVMAIIWWRKKS